VECKSARRSQKTYHFLPIETWLSHSMAVVKLQKLLSNAKRCVFQFAKNDKIL
jgi:hypothetical protein